MKLNIKHKLLIPILLSALVFTSCNKDKDKDNDSQTPDTFDKKAMLTNIGSNIIIPSYLQLIDAVDSLNISIDNFIVNPDSLLLQKTRNHFVQAYLAWQNCSAFEFGPAAGVILRDNVNIFPTDTVQINSNITSGTYDLETIANLDAKGFPAIDFILYGLGTDITYYYTTDANAVNRKEYLSALIDNIDIKVNSVYANWNTSYLTTFSENTGSDIGSSLGQLVNALNFEFELTKNARVGIPLGKKSLGTPLPEKTEGFYSGISVQLAIENTQAIQRLYLGQGLNGTDGLGIDDYLIYLKSSYNGGLLSDAIKSQLSTTISQLQTVNDPLSQTILTNEAIVNDAYTEIQKQVILFKVDMPSALGVLITYQDNDGD